MTRDGRTAWTTPTTAVLFAIVFVARLMVDDPDNGLLFLMILPIAVLALDKGVAGGLAGGAVGAVSLLAWITIDDISLNTVGVATRLGSFFVAGLGVGLLAAQNEKRAEKLRELEVHAQRHEAAIEMNERVLQHLTVVKMSLEMDDKDLAATATDQALEGVRSIVSKDVDPTPGSFRTSRPDAPRS